jgi:hypothetical protein
LSCAVNIGCLATSRVCSGLAEARRFPSKAPQSASNAVGTALGFLDGQLSRGAEIGCLGRPDKIDEVRCQVSGRAGPAELYVGTMVGLPRVRRRPRSRGVKRMVIPTAIRGDGEPRRRRSCDEIAPDGPPRAGGVGPHLSSGSPSWPARPILDTQLRKLDATSRRAHRRCCQASKPQGPPKLRLLV